MESRREFAKDITDLVGELIKNLILEELKNLDPFPEIELAIPERNSFDRYRKTKKIKGIIIYQNDKSPIHKNYIILTPKRLEKIYESCYGYGENMNKFLPSSAPHHKYSLPLISYLRYQEVIFDKIEEVSLKQKA